MGIPTFFCKETSKLSESTAYAQVKMFAFIGTTNDLGGHRGYVS